MSLAILSFFSAVFLPGAIIYKISLNKLNAKFSISHLIICSFVFSLCFNFILIYILSLGGIYTKNVVVGVFVIEIVLFLFLYFRHPLQNLEFPKIDDRFESLLFVFSILIALFVLNGYVFKVDIFYGWDAVVSWNRWATEWASGKFVLNDWGYSQLYPMLLSLGYVASGKVSSFQGIGSAIWGYFAFVGIVACLFGIHIKTISDRILGIIMAIIAYLTFFNFAGDFKIVGYVDLPVAMCILISAIFLFNAFKSDENIKYYLFIGALAAGISVEIKQAGLFWSAVFVIGLLRLAFLKKIHTKDVVLCIFAIAIFCAPWVIIALYKKLILNTAATNASYTMEGIYYGKGYIERLLDAIKRYPRYFALFLASLLVLKDKNFRFFAVFGFIYFLFWGTHLSYDLRNLQGGIPLMIIALSGVLLNYYSFFNRAIVFIYKKLGLIFVCMVALGCVIAPFYEDKVLKGEFKRKMTLGGNGVAEIVLEAFQTRGEKILLTSNQPVSYIPLFDRKYYKLYHFGKSIKDGEFEQYALNLKKSEGNFYILLQNRDFERYREFLSQATILGRAGGWVLLEF